jgi:hypothetical protein
MISKGVSPFLISDGGQAIGDNVGVQIFFELASQHRDFSPKSLRVTYPIKPITGFMPVHFEGMVGTSINNLIKVFDLSNKFVFVKAVRGPCTLFGQSSFESQEGP